jgi:hypothetical protein
MIREVQHISLLYMSCEDNVENKDSNLLGHYSYFHSIMNYSILFWGPCTESVKIFKLQKRIIRIMMGYKRNQSCRELFVKLGILPLQSQYIFFLLMFLFKNKHQFPVNTEIHQYATRQQSNFHQPRLT